VTPDDELEPIADQEEAKRHALELETIDDHEDLIYLAAVVDGVGIAARGDEL
jgi:hypothetical protein